MSDEWKSNLTSAIENIQTVERNTNIKFIFLIIGVVAGYMVIPDGFVDGLILALIVCGFAFFGFTLISKAKTEGIKQSEDSILDYLVSERDKFEDIKEEVYVFLNEKFPKRGMSNSRLVDELGIRAYKKDREEKN